MFVQTSVNKCFKQSPGKCLLLVSKAALRADSCPLLVTDCHQESSASVENPESLELGTSTQSTSSVCSAERTTNACFLQQKEEGGRGVNSGIYVMLDTPPVQPLVWLWMCHGAPGAPFQVCPADRAVCSGAFKEDFCSRGSTETAAPAATWLLCLQLGLQGAHPNPCSSAVTHPRGSSSLCTHLEQGEHHLAGITSLQPHQGGSVAVAG